MDKLLILGTGFIGSHLKHLAMEKGIMTFTAGGDDGADMREVMETDNAIADFQPDYIVNVLGKNGGIGYNIKYPGDIFYDNTVLGLNVLNSAAHSGKKPKVVSLLTSCGYPPPENGGLFEKQYLVRDPHESVACHGYAKRNILLASQFYNKQYGLRSICLVPNTVYGPRDRIDLDRTKVGMALVKKFVDAKREGRDYVELWGSGTALREFIYVEDVCELILQAMYKYDDYSLPLNLGSGQEISIIDLANLIKRVVGFDGEIRTTNQPDGQGRKRLYMDRQIQILGNYDFTPLEEGIRRTVEWYKNIC